MGAAAVAQLAGRAANVLAVDIDGEGLAEFAYDSAASHTDPHLRDIAWSRENAVLAPGTAVSPAQLILART